jgi:hypothetical protein
MVMRCFATFAAISVATLASANAAEPSQITKGDVAAAFQLDSQCCQPPSPSAVEQSATVDCSTKSCHCGHGDLCRCCCTCRDVCLPRRVESVEEKTCWNVKCKKACIPAVRFPWEAGGSGLTLFNWLEARPGRCACGTVVEDGANCRCNCAHPLARCGNVRCVRTLESEKYEATVYRCEWEIRRLPSCKPLNCSQPVGDWEQSTTNSSP